MQHVQRVGSACLATASRGDCAVTAPQQLQFILVFITIITSSRPRLPRMPLPVFTILIHALLVGKSELDLLCLPVFGHILLINTQ